LVRPVVVALVAACTGGPGDLPAGDGGTSSSGSTSSSSSGSSGTNAQIRASDFDQSCTTAADCAAVFEGPICKPCPCENAAIAKKDAEKYASTKAGADCPPQEGDVACAPCLPPIMACNAGKCALR
jgi:hypothetical protein